MGVTRKTLSTPFCLASIWLFFLVSMAAVDPVKVIASTSMTNATNIAKPGCSSKCGNVTIPYPFGFGDQSCSLNQNYHVTCNLSFNPPRPFMRGYEDEFLEISSISETKLRIRNKVAMECYNSTGDAMVSAELTYGVSPLSPFSLSHDSNRLMAIGCNIVGYVDAYDSRGEPLSGYTSCNSGCPSKEKVAGGRCEGVGCCQAVIPKGMRNVLVYVFDTDGSNSVMSNRCSYAFLAEEGTFTFRGFSDFSDPNFKNKIINHVPVVVDWVIGNKTCEDAKKNSRDGSYACQANTTCSNNSDRGYTCSCRPGYLGNPYLSPGCSGNENSVIINLIQIDINECAGVHNCSHICHNRPGNYSCSCPPGLVGDGMKNGSGCSRKTKNAFYMLKLAFGISLGFFGLVLVAISMYSIKKKLNHVKLKQDRFRKNGGLLLQELLSSTSLGHKGVLKIFTLKQLKVATENFSEAHVLGKGGHGIVYKGVLSNNQIVAVKKSKVIDQSQIEEFINEMTILGQINHINVVKIVGCCLESEVPMLVYEYISNGNLFEHIHSNKDERPWLDWSNSIRIATEAAGALAHLHSAVSIPIIHRDVKSSNILIDENYNAKISDFGASRLIPLDQSRLSTIVQGTLGYLDPEYYHSGHITEKSDVYSFGIVLIELLTRQRPVSEERDVTEATLSTYFVNLVKAGTYFSILDPQIKEDAPVEQLTSVVDLISKCLSPRGESRPTMMHVAIELKAIENRVPHPFALQEQHHEVSSHSSQPQEGEFDLYPEEINHSNQPQDEETDLYPVPTKP